MFRIGSDVEAQKNAEKNTENALENIELDEEELKTAGRSEPEEAAGPPKSLVAQTFHWIKIGIVLLIWLVFASALCFVEEKKNHTALSTVTGVNEVKLPIKMGNCKRVKVMLRGPFEGQGTNILNPNTVPLLKVRVQEGDRAISKEWPLEVMQKPDYRAASKKEFEYIFELEEYKRGEKFFLSLRMERPLEEPISVRVEYQLLYYAKATGIVLGALVLVFLYACIIWEFIDRTLASIIASTLAIGLLAWLGDRPTMRQIISWIDMETLILLFGFMILVAILSDSGVFDYLAVYAYKITGGHVWPLVNWLLLLSAVLPALLDNVTMMLLITPVTIRLCEVTEIDPVKVLMSMVVISNIGAALTPVGDPPNVIISMHPYVAANNVNFGTFTMHMLLGCLIALGYAYLHLRIVFRKPNAFATKDAEFAEMQQEIQVWEKTVSRIAPYSKQDDIVRSTMKKKVQLLKKKLADGIGKTRAPTPGYQETLDRLVKEYPIKSRTLLIKSCIVFLGVVILFLLHSVPNIPHLTLGWASFMGALCLLLLADVDDLEALLERVEWATLIFFASLFILMEALTELGLISVIGNMVVNLILAVEPKYRLMLGTMTVLWVSAIASAFLNNIPVATMMIKIIVQMAQNKELNLPIQALVYALAFGTCFGGNGTLIGASANVVSAGVIEQHGYKFRFLDFFIFGFPIMFGTIVTTSIYLLLSHEVFKWHDVPNVNP